RNTPSPPMPPSRSCSRGSTIGSTRSGGGSLTLSLDQVSSAGGAAAFQGARRMADPLRPEILTLSPSTVDTWHRCRREFRSSQLLGIPPTDEGPPPDPPPSLPHLPSPLHRPHPPPP